MPYLAALTLFLFCGTLSGQKIFWLQELETGNEVQQKKINGFADSLAMISHANKKIIDWQNEGYITANLDSLRCRRDTCQAFFYRGEKYAFQDVTLDTFWDKFPEEKKFLQKKIGSPVALARWPRTAEELTLYFMNRGYPFCKVYLKETEVRGGKVKAALNINKGQIFLYDSVVIKGNLKVSNNFLVRYFQIKEGMAYNHSISATMTRRAKSILFAKMTKEPQLRFENEKVISYFYLDRAPVNSFDFILGVLPGTNTTTGAKKWTISGDLKVAFTNRFGQGEYIFGQYKKLRPENQEMILKFSIPYLYNFAFGMDSDFRLFRNGNQHLDLLFSGGIQYPFSGMNVIKIGYQYKSSRLIEINRQNIITTGKLPQNLDVVFRSGMLNMLWWQTDYRFNPSRGLIWEVKINIGQKTIIENNNITSIQGFSDSYAGLTEPTLQVESEMDVQYFIPIKSFGTIRLRAMGGWKYNSTGIRLNEFYRIGGNATLRGFDEESIWTDQFLIVSGEFRLFLDRNSFLSLPFTDFALTRILTGEEKIVDRAIGLGLGINFNTRAGIFNVSFAAGNRLQSGFDFGNMKVHFGYLNMF